jgi:hypothetical protein
VLWQRVLLIAMVFFATATACTANGQKTQQKSGAKKDPKDVLFKLASRANGRELLRIDYRLGVRRQ